MLPWYLNDYYKHDFKMSYEGIGREELEDFHCYAVTYRNEVIHRFVFKGNNWQEKYDIFNNGPSYNKMLYSFKPLKIESFYTPEEIEILLNKL